MHVPGTRHVGVRRADSEPEMSVVRKALCDVYVQEIHRSVRRAHVQAIHSS